MTDRGRMIELRIQPQRIGSLKPITSQAVLAAGNCPRAVIGMPRDPAAAQAAVEFAETLQRTQNLALPRSPEPDTTSAATVVAFGHAGNNATLERLHDARLLTREDYPFAGWHVRSFHDVERPGQCIIAVLGRTLPVLRRGARELFAALRPLDADRLGLPGPLLSTPPPATAPDPAGFTKEAAARDRQALGGRPGSFLTALGWLRRSGDPAWAKAFLSLLEPYATGAIPLSFARMSAVDFWTDQLVVDWSVVEPLPCFNEADRLRVANFIASCTEYSHDSITFQKWRITPEDHQVFNHHTFPARSLFFGCGFLARRWADPPADLQAWSEKALQVFERAASAGRSFDEGGAGYSWLVGTHLLDVMLSRGDHSYAESLYLRHYADLAVMIQNNRFQMVPFGDCTAYHAQGGGAAEILLRTARWHRDGGCKWVARQSAPRLCRNDPFCANLRARPPQDHVGLKVLPMDPVVHRWSRRPTFPGYPPPPRLPNVPPSRGFDKITLRGGWNSMDDYLLLQGFGAGQHGHPDANAISQYQVRERLFLVDCDYIRRAPAQHNMVKITADGVHERPPVTAQLDAATQFEGGAVTQSTLIDDNGCDWQRTIIWLSGEVLLVIDAVSARHDAELDLRCIWRTLGTVSQTARGIAADHAGEWCHIMELSRSEHSLSIEPPQLNAEGYPPYDFGDSRPTVLCERRRGMMRAGQQEVFVNLVAPSGASPRPIHLARLGSAGTIHVQRPQWSLSVSPSEVTLNDRVLHTFTTPLPLAAATAPSLCLHVPDKVPPPSPMTACWSVTPESPATCLFQSRDSCLAGTENGGVLRISCTGTAIPWVRIDGRVNALLEATLFGEGTPTLLVTGDDDCISFFHADKTRRSSTRLPRNSHMPAHGRALCSANLDGDGTLWPIVGTAAWRVHALHPDGSIRWTFDTTAHAVNCLAAADLNNDGRDEIAVGTVYFCVPAITADGTRLWEDEDYNDFWNAGPDFRFIGIADVDGDGRPEVITAASDTLVHCIDAGGMKKWTTSIGDDCAGLHVATGHIWAASQDGSLHLLDGNGTRAVRRVLGNTCTALAVNGALACVATGDARLVIVDQSGRIQAAGQLPTPALKLVWMGPAQVLALTADGTLTSMAFHVERQSHDTP